MIRYFCRTCYRQTCRGRSQSVWLLDADRCPGWCKCVKSSIWTLGTLIAEFSVSYPLCQQDTLDCRPNFICPHRQWEKKTTEWNSLDQCSKCLEQKIKERQKKAPEGKRIFKVRAKKEGHWGHRARNHVCLISLRCGPSLESCFAY